MECESKLLQLIASGESQTLELKKSLSLRTVGLQGLCSMVNTEEARGIVVFGVAPDGEICGLDPGNRDSAQQSMAQAIASGFEPPLIADIRICQHACVWLMVVAASRSGSVPYHEYDGRAWIREGSSKRKLTIEEKGHLAAARDELSHPGPWVCERCGTTVGSISGVVLSDSGVERVIPPCHCGGRFRPAS